MGLVHTAEVTMRQNPTDVNPRRITPTCTRHMRWGSLATNGGEINCNCKVIHRLKEEPSRLYTRYIPSSEY
jgi:hypothetical protein